MVTIHVKFDHNGPPPYPKGTILDARGIPMNAPHVVREVPPIEIATSYSRKAA